MNSVQPTAFLMQSSYCLSQRISSSFNKTIHEKWHIITEDNPSCLETKQSKKAIWKITDNNLDKCWVELEKI